MGFFSRKNSGPVKVTPLSMHWDTEDPFLFASHHEDDYPQGNAQQAPPLSEIGGRDLGRDYEKRLGFRMYHGKVVPGFPMHAHWGYETVTLAEKGFVDHFDTEGIEGRYGFGDVQWICASSKYLHNEMYPLADSENRNPNDITQIFINLPLELKNRENSVRTVWSDRVPVVRENGWEAKIVCGRFGGFDVRSPGAHSWADGDHGVRIIRFVMEPGSSLEIDPATKNANRNLYYISGKTAEIMDTEVTSDSRIKVLDNGIIGIRNGDEASVIWLLEGTPIGQRMSMFGPVCLGDLQEVRAAMNDIRIHEYSDWPWQYVDQAQPRGTERFIRYPDGQEIRP